MDCLNSKSEEMDEAFLNDFGFLSDSILNDTIEAIGYSENLVYEAFEEHFGYESLRYSMDRQTGLYLDSIGFDTTVNNDPNHVLGGKDIQTLFTENGVVNVDDTLLYIKNTGLQYYVTNGDYDLLASIINGTWTPDDMSNVEMHYPNGSVARGSCMASFSNPWMWWYKKIGTQWWAMRGKEGFYNLIWVNRWYSTTESFKQNNQGKFKGNKMITGAGFDSYIFNNDEGDCGETVFNSEFGEYRNKQSYTQPSPDYAMFRIDKNGHNCSHDNDKINSVKWRLCTW